MTDAERLVYLEVLRAPGFKGWTCRADESNAGRLVIAQSNAPSALPTIAEAVDAFLAPFDLSSS